jgi:HEAT repeat protein
MNISVGKIVVVAAIVCGGLWYLERQPPPEAPVETSDSSETRKEVRRLLKRSRRAGVKRKAEIQESLRAIGPAGVPALVEALEDEDPKIRAVAAETLKYSGGRSVAPHLEARLTDNHPAVRKAALTALGQLGTSETVPAVIKALDDGDRVVRCHAALALGSLGDERALMPLISVLHGDPYNVARRSAANSLGEIGSLKALRALKAAREDPDPQVRMAAESAVKRIKEFGPIGQDVKDLGNWLDDKLRELNSEKSGES